MCRPANAACRWRADRISATMETQYAVFIGPTNLRYNEVVSWGNLRSRRIRGDPCGDPRVPPAPIHCAAAIPRGVLSPHVPLLSDACPIGQRRCPDATGGPQHWGSQEGPLAGEDGTAVPPIETERRVSFRAGAEPHGYLRKPWDRARRPRDRSRSLM